MVGARGVLTGLGTQPARVAPTLVHINTQPPEGVVLVARLAFAAIGTGQILAQLAFSTLMEVALTFIHVDTPGSIRTGMVAAAADNLPVAHVGAHCVDATKA